MFAVAGSGKTTKIVERLSLEKRSLIVTYTNNNRENLQRKILLKFDGIWPENITLMTYFSFLYGFCYKPFLSDRVKAKGIIYERNPNQRLSQSQRAYYLPENRFLYSNRLSLLLENCKVIDDVKNRIETYFDEFLIDEVQDIAGRDFSLLEMLMEAKVNMLFVGDFFQHTYDTSRDGNMNKSLFKNKATYESRFVRRGFIIDSTTLVKSWRCSKSICDFVNKQLGICIASNRGPNDDTSVTLVTDPDNVSQILDNRHIVKLHYQMSSRYGDGHKNWGDTKGEDCYQDVCVMLNRTTAAKFKKGQLQTLPPATRNRLYVAITRAHGKCFFIIEK